MNRRSFLELSAAASAAAGLARSASAAPVEIEEMTVSDMAAALSSGRLTARGLAEMYMARIEVLDRGGPRLHSVIELNPDVLQIADELDRRPKEGRGPLHGIPILVKDNIDTGDRMATSAGSLLLAGARAARDAVVVARLRAAGAVILGKTNLSEWANIRSTHATSGWSGRGGLTKNPYVLDRNPCGSSSGSGVAVSANLAAMAVGTETDGSVVCPSGTNGIVGIKPTLGWVSRTGIVPIAHSQDTAGAMARTVRDAALLLEAMGGTDPANPETVARKERPLLVSALDAGALRGARIGVVRKQMGFHHEVDALMEQAFDALKKAGAVLVNPVELPHAGEYDEAELLVLEYELKADLNRYLGARGVEGARSLADVIRFNEAHRDREMAHFGQDLFEKSQARGPLTDAAYKEALDKCRRLSRTEGIDAALAKDKLDVMVAPTNGPAWLTDLVNGDHFTGGFSSAAAVAGYPHVTVPAGFVRELPIGLSFFGAAWSEPRLLALAFAFEQATKARRPPRFLPTLGLTP